MERVISITGRSAARFGAVVVLGLGAAACAGSGPVEPEGGDGGGTVLTADVTFVFDAIPDSVVRIDVAVTGNAMEQINGSFDPTTGADRVTIAIPLGERRNAFARGFNVQNTIAYIGEVNFAVMSTGSYLFHIPLNYKGDHFPGKPVFAQ